MTGYIWFAPGVALVFLLGVLYKLGRRQKSLNRQTKKLNGLVTSFLEKSKLSEKKSETKKFERPELDDAVKARKAYQKGHAKAKAERQRRLVDRLNRLSKTERGKSDV
jgi:hypothetical protein